ncbi:MAG: hypothetical protein RIB59_16365, partial [Rhodospirillales bacterium]
MSDDAFALATKASTLLSLPIEAVLSESKDLTCGSYASVFFEKIRESDEGRLEEFATAWRLIARLSQMMLQESNPSEPFRPVFEGPGGRSILPSDIDD